jgi:hypothetical protein
MDERQQGLVRNASAVYARDAAIYDIVRKHGIRPVVFDITPAEAAELAERFAEMFRFPALDDAPADTRDDARRQSDAALLNAIKKRG